MPICVSVAYIAVFLSAWRSSGFLPCLLTWFHSVAAPPRFQPTVCTWVNMRSPSNPSGDGLDVHAPFRLRQRHWLDGLLDRFLRVQLVPFLTCWGFSRWGYFSLVFWWCCLASSFLGVLPFFTLFVGAVSVACCCLASFGWGCFYLSFAAFLHLFRWAGPLSLSFCVLFRLPFLSLRVGLFFLPPVWWWCLASSFGCVAFLVSFSVVLPSFPSFGWGCFSSLPWERRGARCSLAEVQDGIEGWKSHASRYVKKFKDTLGDQARWLGGTHDVCFDNSRFRAEIIGSWRTL